MSANRPPSRSQMQKPEFISNYPLVTGRLESSAVKPILSPICKDNDDEMITPKSITDGEPQLVLASSTSAHLVTLRKQQKTPQKRISDFKSTTRVAYGTGIKDADQEAIEIINSEINDSNKKKLSVGPG